MWKQILIAVAAAVLLTPPARAQQLECGCEVKPRDHAEILARQAAGLYDLQGGAAAGGTVYQIPIVVHMMRRSDGTGLFDPVLLDPIIEGVNEQWVPMGMQFCRIQTIEHHDDQFFNMVSSFVLDIENGPLYLMDNHPNAIDLYITDNLAPWCGFACFTHWDRYGIVVEASACLSVDTLSHELGHYFDLYHTFEGIGGAECPDGSNCATVGDLVCDTPADPSVWSGCDYAGPDTLDGCGGIYDPDPTNQMSYASGTCRTGFTPQQAARAPATLENLRAAELLSDPTPCTITSGCLGATGGCYASNGTVGCEDGQCCDLICAYDPFCCDSQWDGLCAGQALELCSPCGESGAGNCFAGNGTPGCTNGFAGDTCCSLVCAVDPTCCSSVWDQTCANMAIDMCGSGCGDAGAGPCGIAGNTPGCSDGSVCQAVCEVLPYCCEVQWDAICVGVALEMGLISAPPGDECPTAITISDGIHGPLTLSDNSNATGDDSSCGFNDTLDEWYRYVATCTGTATASMCTEFSSVQITLAVFEGNCGGTEVACSASPDPNCSLGSGVAVTWDTVQGASYYVRISGVNATQQSNFTSALVLDCAGCGADASGDCFSANGSAFCEDGTCCVFVCAIDPFCCDNTWDALCADQAAENCVEDCGGAITGNCYVANGSPYCRGTDCCESVCAADPFCCATNWDSICAEAAQSMCTFVVLPDGVPFIPIGDATLAINGQQLQIGGIGDTYDDGALMLAGQVGDIEAVELDLTPQTYGGNPRVGIEVDLAPGTQAFVTAGTIGIMNTQGVFPSIFAAFEYGNGIEYYHDVELRLNGTTMFLFETQSSQIGDALDPPDTYATEIVTPNCLTMRLAWDGTTTFTGLLGPTLVVDEVLVHSTGFEPVDGDLGAIGGDSGGGGATAISELRLLGQDIGGGLTITNGDVETVCSGDVNNDDVVDVVDLLAVIGSWGPALPGQPADIAPPGGDGLIAVDDLLQVLEDWGACPD